MQIKSLAACLSLLLCLTACTSTRSSTPTKTPLTLPSPTPITVRPRATPTSPSSPTVELAALVTATTATSTPSATDSPPVEAEGDSSRPPVSGRLPGVLPRADAPAAIEAVMRQQGIESSVYWFASGDEQQLMIQFRSPLRHHAGYADRLEAVKRVAAEIFLRIDPPLLTLYIAATDITGTSDTVLRLDRLTVERWAGGQLGGADFYNNGFVPSGIVIACAEGKCTGVRPTPFPTFPPFPFPFPTPTP